MTSDAQVPSPSRVSIFERIVPSLAFALAAISGAIGAVLFLKFLNEMRNAETAGYASFFGGVAEIEITVGVVLTLAAALCAIGILVSVIRLFTTNTTSSPPGLAFLFLGLLSLVPPFATHYILHWAKRVVLTPGEGGVSSIADTITTVMYIAIAWAVLIAVVLLVFSFVAFTSRPGRKALPLIALMLIQIAIAVMTGVYFWEARASYAERDKDRSYLDDQYYSSKSTDVNSNATIEDLERDLDADSNTTSSSNAKTISGGVLNGKAIELPGAAYPPAARAVRASGQVSVQVTVDTKGEVVAASAVSGHPLLRAAAVQAARKAKFKPTLLSGQPVKVTGVITYNFSLQ
jgi:TonB family protein